LPKVKPKKVAITMIRLSKSPLKTKDRKIEPIRKIPAIKKFITTLTLLLLLRIDEC
jgi:hypothetical protein